MDYALHTVFSMSTARLLLGLQIVVYGWVMAHYRKDLYILLWLCAVHTYTLFMNNQSDLFKQNGRLLLLLLVC